MIYIPVMVSQLIAGYIWYFMVQYDQGALNDIMLLLGAEPLDWMAQGARAVVIITLINGVQYVGKTMIIFIAGLNGIPTITTRRRPWTGRARGKSSATSPCPSCCRRWPPTLS